MKTSLRVFLLVGLAALFPFLSVNGSAGFLPTTLPDIYLPLVSNSSGGTIQPAGGYRINTPYFQSSLAGLANDFSQMAITWYGQVSSNAAYSDVRVGYSDQGLFINVTTFDRYLWYNPSPSTNTLNQWDGATLYLDTSGGSRTSLGLTSFRFDSALSWFEPRNGYQAAYVGSSGRWALSGLAFTTIPGYRGTYNSVYDSRGWSMTFEIPFSSLGLSTPPAQGTVWAVGLATHNRNSQAGPPLPDQVYPPGMSSSNPATWAQVHFGLPAYSSPNLPSSGQAFIQRATQTSGMVPDSAVGGASSPNLCPGDTNFIWNAWGNTNYGSSADFNIQNQSDVSDWPCFAKYYITFPLDQIPANVRILSATLTLHQQGQAGDPGQSYPSLIQVMTISPGWSESGVTWNNGPEPVENVSQAWVNGDVIGCGTSALPWPCVPRQFDLSYAVAQAYQAGQSSISLAFYEADDHQHSGKYFTSSNTGDWNKAGRPSLTINWAAP